MNDLGSGYIWGGTVAGLLVIGAVGLWLALRGHRLVSFLTPYVGDRHARRFLYGAWFVYGYGLISALSQIAYPFMSSIGPDEPPSAVSFLYGMMGQSTLPFLRSVVPVIQILAFLAAVVVIARCLPHVRPEHSSADEDA